MSWVKRSRSSTGFRCTRTWMRLASAAYGARCKVCTRWGWPMSQTVSRSRLSRAKFRNAGKSRKKLGWQILSFIDRPDR